MTTTVSLYRVLARGRMEHIESRKVAAPTKQDRTSARTIAKQEFPEVARGQVVIVYFDGGHVRLTPSQINN